MKVSKAQDRYSEPITQDVIDRAIERGNLRKSSGLHAIDVKYLKDNKSLLVSFADHTFIGLPVSNYAEFSDLNDDDFNRMSIEFGGSALVLDDKDIHVSIAGLIKASKSLMELASKVIAVRNGSVITAAKIKASRENGLKGGRPRRAVAA